MDNINNPGDPQDHQRASYLGYESNETSSSGMGTGIPLAGGMESGNAMTRRRDTMSASSSSSRNDSVVLVSLAIFRDGRDGTRPADEYYHRFIARNYRGSEINVRRKLVLNVNDNVDPAYVLGLYDRMVELGKLPDLGKIIDMVQGIGSDGRSIVVLIFSWQGTYQHSQTQQYNTVPGSHTRGNVPPGPGSVAIGMMRANPRVTDPTIAAVIEMVAGLVGFAGIGHILTGRTKQGCVLLMAWWVAQYIIAIIWYGVFGIGSGLPSLLYLALHLVGPMASGLWLRSQMTGQPLFKR